MEAHLEALILTPPALPTRVVYILIHQKYSVSQPKGTVSHLLEITIYLVKFQHKFSRTVCRQLKYNDFLPLRRQFPLRRQLER